MGGGGRLLAIFVPLCACRHPLGGVDLPLKRSLDGMCLVMRSQWGQGRQSIKQAVIGSINHFGPQWSWVPFPLSQTCVRDLLSMSKTSSHCGVVQPKVTKVACGPHLLVGCTLAACQSQVDRRVCRILVPSWLQVDCTLVSCCSHSCMHVACWLSQVARSLSEGLYRYKKHKNKDQSCTSETELFIGHSKAVPYDLTMSAVCWCT